MSDLCLVSVDSLWYIFFRRAGEYTVWKFLYQTNTSRTIWINMPSESPRVHVSSCFSEIPKWFKRNSFEQHIHLRRCTNNPDKYMNKPLTQPWYQRTLKTHHSDWMASNTDTSFLSVVYQTPETHLLRYFSFTKWLQCHLWDRKLEGIVCGEDKICLCPWRCWY